MEVILYFCAQIPSSCISRIIILEEAVFYIQTYYIRAQVLHRVAKTHTE